MSNAVIKQRMRDAFLRRIYERMKTEEDIFFLTADFGSPVLDGMRADFPERFINVGIAEQSLINTTAGIALEGFRVTAYAIAPFLTMRCLEQIRINLAILSQVRPMNVTLLGVGAGLSYEVSGPTHQALEDIAVMRAVANVDVWSPSDAGTAACMADAALEQSGIRYVRLDSFPLPDIANASTIEFRRGFREFEMAGATVAVISTGYMTHLAQSVCAELSAAGIRAGIIDLFNLSSPDFDALAETVASCGAILTVEEGFIGRGGMDCLLRMNLAEKIPAARFLHAGLLPSYNFETGPRNQLLEKHGLAPVPLAKLIIDSLKS